MATADAHAGLPLNIFEAEANKVKFKKKSKQSYKHYELINTYYLKKQEE